MTEFSKDQGWRVWQSLDTVLKQIENPETSLSGIIEDNEECRRQHAELKRLHAALKTYLDTDARFRYVAFVGSFSSGKTATINNLLHLPVEHRRAENIDPVDDRLTVCVHEEQKESVLAALIKTSWDADKFLHSTNDLVDIILVDTPGAGDPKIRTDIVYNFLPICDTVVYCFNATNPLNTNDVPILRELNEVLQHTDFFYVYTRADNVFRINERKTLTANNFDRERANRQRDTFIERLAQALGAMPGRTPELQFVSNGPGQFGIKELRQRLLTPPGDATSLALKKIGFFRSRSVDAVSTILSVLDKLRVTVGELVSRAEQNHQVYNKRFEIRTEEIKEFWRSAQNILQKTTTKFKELKTDQVSEPINLSKLESKALQDANSHDQIQGFSKTATESLISESLNTSKREFDSWKEGIRDRLYKDTLEFIAQPGARAELTNSTTMTIAIEHQKFIDDANDLLEKIVIGASEKIVKSISQQCKKLKADFEKASRHCLEGELFANEKQLRAGCKREISSAVDHYGTLIDLYVSGINTAGTMLLIEQADLATDIDFLQKERIDDDEKRETSERLINDIFGPDQQNLAAIERRCHLFPQELKTLINEIDALRLRADALAGEIANASLDEFDSVLSSAWDHALKPIVNRYVGWQVEEREKIVSWLVREYETTRDRFEFKRNLIMSGWRNRIGSIGIGGALLITLSFGIFYQFGGSPGQSLSEVVIWGAVGNALWALIVVIFRRARSNRVEWTSKSRSDFFRSETLSVSRKLREQEFRNPPDLTSVGISCRSRLSDDLTGVVYRGLHLVQVDITPLTSEIESVRSNGHHIVNEYRRYWEQGRQIIGHLYQETDEKVMRFKEVATAFKQRTIDRTRQLFGKRGSELEQYISQLEEQASEMQQAP